MSELSQPPVLSGIAQAMQITRGEWGGGKASVRVLVDDSHTNKGGVAHGGLYTMMLDMSCGGALVSILPAEEWCATTQLSISFLSPSKPGDELVASGELVKRGRNVAHLRGKIVNSSGKEIATATGTWAIWQSKPNYMPGRIE